MTSDLFDNVIDFEQQEYTKGEVDGRTDAIDSGEMLENGRKSGYLKGLAYGLEIGFYKAVAEERLHVLEIASTTAQQPSSSTTTTPTTTTPNHTTRIAKWSTQLTQRTNAFPITNINPFDFDNEIRELRGLYRLCGSQIGPFRPIHSTSSTTAATTAATIQQQRTDTGGTTTDDHQESNHVFVAVTAAAHDW